MEMTKEIMYDQFKKLKSNPEKVKYLVDLKEMKQKTPHVFRNIKINITQFNNLIREYSSLVPFGAMHREIAERQEQERKLEMAKKKENDETSKDQFKKRVQDAKKKAIQEKLDKKLLELQFYFDRYLFLLMFLLASVQKKNILRKNHQVQRH